MKHRKIVERVEGVGIERQRESAGKKERIGERGRVRMRQSQRERERDKEGERESTFKLAKQ